MVNLSVQAIEKARAADRARLEGGCQGKLHGVPVTIKINIDVEGQANSNGVVAFRERAGRPAGDGQSEEGRCDHHRDGPPRTIRFWYADHYPKHRRWRDWRGRETDDHRAGGSLGATLRLKDPVPGVNQGVLYD